MLMNSEQVNIWKQAAMFCFKGTVPTLARRDWRKPQTGYVVTGHRFEPQTAAHYRYTILLRIMYN